MPRLSIRLIKSAWKISPLVALLLRACRDIRSAKNELRWISEHVTKTTSNSSSHLERGYQARLFELCKSRSRGVPLQYILGTQPFGDLEIKCRKGVLIPRSETEAYTLEMGLMLLNELRQGGNFKITSQLKKQKAEKDLESRPPVRILDICSGTGCISLSLYAQLRYACPALEVVGVDISPKAIKLARENITCNNLQVQQKQSISYHKGDIFSPSADVIEILGLDSDLLASPVPDERKHKQKQQKPSSTLESERKNSNPSSRQELEPKWNWDLIISNPPYISAKSFSRDTTRSVRNFEPKLALVPPQHEVSAAAVETTDIRRTACNSSASLTSVCQPEDVFYARILDLASDHLKPKRILFEVADFEQARRVVELALLSRQAVSDSDTVSGKLEIWRDDPSQFSFSSSRGGSTSYSGGGEGEEKPEQGEGVHVRRITVNGREIPIRGSGNVRSVYFFVGVGPEESACN